MPMRTVHDNYPIQSWKEMLPFSCFYFNENPDLTLIYTSFYHCESSQPLGRSYCPDLGIGLACSGFRPAWKYLSPADGDGASDGWQARGRRGPGCGYRKAACAMEYHGGRPALGAARI